MFNVTLRNKTNNCQNRGKIMNKKPCDQDVACCPFDATGSMDCYNHCGVGASENVYDPSEEFEEDVDSTYALEESKESKIKIIVHMEGGLVQSVLTDSNDFIDVIVMEFDDQSEPYEDAVEVMKEFTADSKFRETGHDSTLVPNDYQVSVVGND